MRTEDGRLVLVGVTHRLEVCRRESGSFVVSAWSPSVLTGDTAEVALSPSDAAELASFLAEEDRRG